MKAAIKKNKFMVEDPVLVERRQAQIALAAIKLFSEQGYYPTTIREVAENANVSVGMIYQYFQDKEELLFFSLVEILNAYKRQIPIAIESITDPLERFCAAVRAYCSVPVGSVNTTVLAYRETKSLSKARRKIVKQMEVETNELIAECIRDCIKSGVFFDTDIELFTYQIVLFSHAWALKAWYFAPKMTVDEYVNRGLRLMLNAVLTGKGERQWQLLRDTPVHLRGPSR